MTTIGKMLIKGVRSFDPENRDVIEFFKPLTLIVGANGSGKVRAWQIREVAAALGCAHARASR